MSSGKQQYWLRYTERAAFYMPVITEESVRRRPEIGDRIESPGYPPPEGFSFTVVKVGDDYALVDLTPRQHEPG